MAVEPDEIVLGPARYVRDAGLIAVAVTDAESAPAGALWVTERPRLAVVRVEDAGGRATGPVYRAASGGTLAVPTGRVFVRFGEDCSPDEQNAIAQGAGYRTESTPSWAPHSAWLVAAVGGAREALAALPGLLARRGVRHAEPELLRPAARRG